MDRSESGDSLIEVLIALVIIATTVGALLGALVTSITSSAQHRGLSVDDTILKSFAEDAKYEIELAVPASGQSSPPPEYVPCQSSYLLLGAVNPISGARGTSAVVFGSGFTQGGPALTLTMVPTSGGAGIPVTTSSGSPYDSNGDVTVAFTLPSVLTVGSGYYVKVAQGSTSVTAPTPFIVQSGAASSSAAPEAGFSLQVGTIVYGQQQGGAFSSTGCPTNQPDTASLAQIPLTASSPSGVAQQLSLLVRNPNYVP